MTASRLLPLLVLFAATAARAEPQPDEHPRCMPSCYHTEKPAKESGTSIKTCGYFTKGITEADLGRGRFGPPEVNQGATQGELVPSCKFPTPGKKWAALTKATRGAVDAKPGDVVFVPDSETWGECTVGDEPARCIDLYWYGKKMDFDITDCGTGDLNVRCEGGGNPAARAINVAHFRVDEATKLSAGGNKADCKKAALEAVAVSRGLAKSNIGFADEDTAKYKTLFDGTLNRQALTKKLAELGKQATALYKGCGGGEPRTSDEDEQSYHARW